MRKPPELVEAETVYGLCQAYHVLPSAVLAESTGLLRMHAVLSEGGYFERSDEGRGAGEPRDPFTDIPMVALS